MPRRRKTRARVQTPEATRSTAQTQPPAAQPNHPLEYLLLAAIVIIAVAVRIFHFGDIPAGLNQDEAATAYDAFALSQTGADRHGIFNPVILTSWGNGQYALPAWLTIPFVQLLGLNILSARLPYLLFGLASLPLVYFIARQIAGRTFALCALFILAVAPWHIMQNRWALDANLFPHIFLIAFYFLLRALDNYRWIYAFAATLALSLYAYGTAYLFAPLFAAFALAVSYRRKCLPFAPGNGKTTVFAVVIAGITATPIGLYLLVNLLQLDAIRTPFFTAPRLPGIPRYEAMASLFSPEFFAQTWHNLRALFAILIVSGHDGLLWNAMPAHGYLYLFAPLLWLPGVFFIAVAAHKNKHAPAYLLLAWFAAAFVTAMVVAPNLNRINIILYPLVFAAAYSLYWLLNRHRPAAYSVAAVLVASFVWFSHSYFGDYRDKIGARFHESLHLAIKHAAANAAADDIITVTHGNQPYIAVLFHLQTDPREFIATAQIQSQGLQFHRVHSFGRYRFSALNPDAIAGGGVFIVHNSQLPAFDRERHLIRSFKHYSAVYDRANYHAVLPP